MASTTIGPTIRGGADAPRSDHTFHIAREGELRCKTSLVRASVIIGGMENYVVKSGDALVVIEMLEIFLLGTSDVAGIITALAGNDCDESKSFELIEISEGHVVAAAWRYEECP